MSLYLSNHSTLLRVEDETTAELLLRVLPGWAKTCYIVPGDTWWVVFFDDETIDKHHGVLPTAYEWLRQLQVGMIYDCTGWWRTMEEAVVAANTLPRVATTYRKLRYFIAKVRWVSTLTEYHPEVELYEKNDAGNWVKVTT